MTQNNVTKYCIVNDGIHYFSLHKQWIGESMKGTLSLWVHYSLKVIFFLTKLVINYENLYFN